VVCYALYVMSYHMLTWSFHPVSG